MPERTSVRSAAVPGCEFKERPRSVFDFAPASERAAGTLPELAGEDAGATNARQA